MMLSSPDVTPEQQEIYDYRPFNMAIIAPAGCGKTEALAYRAKGLLERFDFSGNGRKLLIISFTNQARDNIRERLAKYISAQELRRHVTVCNFHGLAARIIQAHGNVIGLDDTWEIADYDWVSKTLEKQTRYREIRAQVSAALRNAKLSHLSDYEVMEELKSRSGQIGQFAVSIENTRLKRKIITYDDQLRTALWILRDQRVSQVYRNHFFAALVDEFQDLTSQQLQLVKALCGNSVTYAGDIAQSIFSFAGADPNYISQEISKSCSKLITLSTSYRSAPAVLDAVNSLSCLTGGKHLSAAFPSHWGNGGLSGFASFKDDNHEASWVVGMAQHILRHCPNQRVGIISRTAFRSGAIKRLLASKGIDYADWGNGAFSPRAAKVLRDICDGIEAKSFNDTQDIHRYIQQQFAALEIPTEEFADAASWLNDQYSQYQNGSLKISEIKSNIKVRKTRGALATDSGIHCLTGHAGKGQQFDWVFIVGFEQGTMPFYKAEDKNEEARILSVMISRARIGFVVTSASTVGKQSGKKHSEFLYYLQKNSNFINGRADIVKWCSAADWSAIAHM